jgi:hypothetical protein
MSLEKLVVEPKTLGWEHSPNLTSKNVFENLGEVSTPLNFFSNDLENGVGQGS